MPLGTVKICVSGDTWRSRASPSASPRPLLSIDEIVRQFVLPAVDALSENEHGLSVGKPNRLYQRRRPETLMYVSLRSHVHLELKYN